MKSIFSLIVISALLFGCSKDDDNSSPSTPPEKPTQNNQFTKLGDLSLVDYKSSGCVAKVSGVDSPMQLLFSYRCNSIDYAYTLNCSSNFLCTGTYENNKAVEAGLSQDFKQIVVVWYKADGGVSGSESFVILEEAK